MKLDHTKWFLIAGFTVFTLTLVAWKGSNNTPQFKACHEEYKEDTVKPRKKIYRNKKEFYVGDLDKAMRELDEAMVDMDKNTRIDFSKMDREIKAALEEVKKIDFEKIGREVEASLKEVDWTSTRREVERAMREAEKEISEIDLKQVHKEVAKAMESVSAAKINAHIDMREIHEQVEKGLEAARTGIHKAEREISQLKEFTGELEKDGLINRKKGFKLEIKDNELFINGTKQSKEVNDKYRKYFKDGDYVIKSDGEDISSI